MKIIKKDPLKVKTHCASVFRAEPLFIVIVGGMAIICLRQYRGCLSLLGVDVFAILMPMLVVIWYLFVSHCGN